MTLLEFLLPSQDHDALLGDISEESRHRSRFWYWSQLLAAVVVGSWREVRRHPLLALCAFATGTRVDARQRLAWRPRRRAR